MDYLFQCVVSSAYRVCHKLILGVSRCMGIFHLVLYVLGIFQVLLDVQNRQRLENILVFCRCFCFFFVIFSPSSSFLQSSGFRCRSRSILLW